MIAVDVDQKNSALYKQYGQYYPGQGIPHAVILDENGKVLGTIGGFVPYPDLLQEFKQDTQGK